MKLEDVNEIKTCRSDAEVNKAIKDGFVLKKILQSKTNNGDGEEVSPCFILARYDKG